MAIGSIHDGLSRLALFRKLQPNTPFITLAREDQGAGQAYGGAAARDLHAWLVPVASDSMAGPTDVTARALKGELPPR